MRFIRYWTGIVTAWGLGGVLFNSFSSFLCVDILIYMSDLLAE